MSGLGDSASATWVPQSALEPFVEISQMDGAYELPHSSPDAREVRGDWRSAAELGRMRACVLRPWLRRWGRRAVQDGRRSELPRRRHVLEMLRSSIRPRSHVAALGLSHREPSFSNLPSSARLGRDRPKSQPGGRDSPREDGRLDLQGRRRGRSRVLCYEARRRSQRVEREYWRRVNLDAAHARVSG